MKKSLQLLCLAIALALIPAALLVAGDLPPDTGEYVQKKYAGWNGVLRGWISSRWEAGGSFVRWLNACASAFEKTHEGVYLEFTQVEEAALQQMASSGIRPPDLAFFSPGVMDNGTSLLPVDPPEKLLPDLQNMGGRCFPVAMGGYIWAYNRSLQNGPPVTPDQMIAYPADDPGRCFSAALPALMSSDPSAGEMELPKPGIDLGLSVNTAAELSYADALDTFIDGDLPCLPVTQKEIARLVRLQDSGKGPDWDCAATGNYALADQLLFCAAVDTHASDGRQEIALEFAAYLCTEDCQHMLADISAFPVTGLQIYPAHSAYAELASLLQSRRLLTSNPFSEYSTGSFAAIVREFRSDRITAADALRRMGFLGEG